MSISNSESRTTEAAPRKEHSTALRAGSIGVMGILFFVLSAQAPLTGIVGASPLAAALGNGAGAPGAYLIVGIVIVIEMTKAGFRTTARGRSMTAYTERG